MAHETEDSNYEDITVTSDITIPSYQDLALPYSQWETHRSQELLEANGFGKTPQDWRRAATHDNSLISSAALYLLTRNPDPQDKTLFHQGLSHPDETVQVLSAYGLYQLTDRSGLARVEAIASLDSKTNSAAPLAAGILAQLGDPSAFSTIQISLDSDLEYYRLLGVQNLVFFIPFHGQVDAQGYSIDLWQTYSKALRDTSSAVRSVAKLELEEIDTPEARRLLQGNPNSIRPDYQ